MIARAHTAPRPIALDIAIARRAGRAVAAANTQPQGRSAHAARAWIETLQAKAQIQAERRARAS